MVCISVIIPVYNVEKYLKDCLDSIIQQTFKDIEVICIDDGSTDKSYEILCNYAENDLRFIVKRQAHQGAGAARNLGLEYAKGKYVIFLDSDDIFASCMLEDLYNTAENNSAEMVVCSARKVDEQGNIIERGNPLWPLNVDKVPFDKVFNWKNFPKDIFSLFCVVPWNKLYLRSFIVENNLRFQNLSSSNDVAFSHISRVCADKIVVINKELIDYRYNRNGSIAQERAESSANIIKAAVFVKEFLIKKGIFEELREGYYKVFIKHIRSGVSLCNEMQCSHFIHELKRIMPQEWYLFKSAFQDSNILMDSINSVIGDKKVLLWGASAFIRKILEKETIKNPNIIGIVDKNTALCGKMCGNYKIYSPDSIKELSPEGILMTVYADNEEVYCSIKKEIKEKSLQVELLPNIFQ